MRSATILKIPHRPKTVKRYLDIVRYAHGKNKGVVSVAKHFGISPATVINASRAFGMSYEEIKQRRSLPVIRLVERQLASGAHVDERTRRIVEMYNSKAMPTMEEIGRKVGLTRQRVHQIIKEAEKKGLNVVRREPTLGHWIERCRICRRMRKLAARYPLTTTRGIARSLNIPVWKVHWHLNKLKAQGLVPEHFGHFRSERIIQAIKLYNRNPSLSAWKLGQKLGYKNLPAVFRGLRQRGFGYLLVPRAENAPKLSPSDNVGSRQANQARISSKSWGRKTAKRLSHKLPVQ